MQPPVSPLVGNESSGHREHSHSIHACMSQSVVYGPDGTTFLARSRGGTARLWNAFSGKPIIHQASATAAAYSPDGKTLVIGSSDNMARLWDTSTGRPILTTLKHEGRVMSVAFSPDGKTVLTGSEDKTARLWDAATGQPIGQPMMHQEWSQFPWLSAGTVRPSSPGPTVRRGCGMPHPVNRSASRSVQHDVRRLGIQP